MRQFSGELLIQTPGQGLHEISGEIEAFLLRGGFREGLLTLFIRHTSCSLLIQENAAPAARRDLERYFAHIAPEGRGYEHDSEGSDDMPAHLRSALTQTSLSIPVREGEMALGTWQGIYLFEHRRSAHQRKLAMHIIGE